MSKKFRLETGQTPNKVHWYRIIDENNTPIPFIPYVNYDGDYPDSGKKSLQMVVDWLNNLTKTEIPEKIPEKYTYLDSDEVFYITDTTRIRSIDDFKKIFSDPEYEYTPDEIDEVSKQEYWQEVYENSMDGKEITEKLNYYNLENYHLKKRIAELEEELDYKREYSMPCKVIHDYIDYRKEVIKIIDGYLELYYAWEQQGIRPSLKYDQIGLLKQIKEKL